MNYLRYKDLLINNEDNWAIRETYTKLSIQSLKPRELVSSFTVKFKNLSQIL